MSVLIISKTLDSEGGVANFIRLLTNRLDIKYSPEQFPIGVRKKGPSRNRDRVGLLLCFIKLYFKVIQLKPDIVHLNPSLNMNSIIRDMIFLIIVK